MQRPPASVLFACNYNAVRSPMAEGIAKHLYGHGLFVDSVGVRRGDLDPFVIVVMEEIGIDVSGHRAKTFDDLEDDSFDLIISLTPQAQHAAVELTRHLAADVEYWATYDPTLADGSREVMLQAYREVRDSLFDSIRQRFRRR